MKGFTLIELIVVVALVAIVAVIAVPNFQRLVESNRLSAGTNSVVSILNYARSEALREGRRIDVSARVDGEWEEGLTVAQGDNTLRVSESLGGNLRVTGENMFFRGNGMAGSAASFRICRAGANTQGRLVSVTEGGRIRTEEVICE